MHVEQLLPVADEVPGISHLDVKRFGGGASGDRAAVVIRKHDHCLTDQFRIERGLARAVERIAVDQAEYRDGRLHLGANEGRDDGPDFSLVGDGQWLLVGPGGLKPPLAAPVGELAYQDVAVDHGDPDAAGRWRCRGVGDEDVAVLDAAFDQRVAPDPHRG